MALGEHVGHPCRLRRRTAIHTRVTTSGQSARRQLCPLRHDNRRVDDVPLRTTLIGLPAAWGATRSAVTSRTATSAPPPRRVCCRSWTVDQSGRSSRGAVGCPQRHQRTRWALSFGVRCTTNAQSRCQAAGTPLFLRKALKQFSRLFADVAHALEHTISAPSLTRYYWQACSKPRVMSAGGLCGVSALRAPTPDHVMVISARDRVPKAIYAGYSISRD